MSQPPNAQPDPAAWAAPSAPSWAPAWQPPGGPVTAAPAAAPAHSNSRLVLALAAAVGLLVGMVGTGIAVSALFAGSARDIGREIADQVGPAVEEGIVDGSQQAMEDAMGGVWGAFPEDMGMPGGGGPIPAAEQFPPVPPEDLGPDPVLDDYAQQCFDGELQSCDDILYESPPLSAYEAYGATCGGRVKEYTVASCTELE